MSAQIRLLKVLLILIFSAAILAPLTSCAPAALGAVEMGIEPSATPASRSLTNQEYGFRFSYPVTWTASERDHQIVLKKGSLQLAITYRWVSENVQSARTGLAAGTPIYRGKVNFLGQIVPVDVVELDHFRKYVLFGDSGNTQADDLAFFIILEDVETDYSQLNIPQDAIAEATSILATFERIDATGYPPDQTMGAGQSARWQAPVIAWSGHIASSPASSQYDDMVVLSPEGTGEFGVKGATPELDDEIQALRDAAGPNEFVHFWGVLSCGEVPDYNDCQLVVDRMQYGANSSEQEIADWIGTIKTSTFNGDQSYVFELDGSIPMWYSIQSSQSESLQAQIAYYEQEGERVEVSGELVVGVPDVNGTRIEITSIEPMSMAGPRPDISNGVLYVNEEYKFSFEYSPEMTLVEESNLVLLDDGDVQLRIGFRWADESVNIAQAEDLEGEFHPYNELFFFEQPVEPLLNIQQGRIHGVYLGGPGVELGQGTPHRFAISLVSKERGWLSNGEVDRMLQIVNTIKVDS